MYIHIHTYISYTYISCPFSQNDSGLRCLAATQKALFLSLPNQCSFSSLSHLKQSTMYSAAQVQNLGVSFSFMPISSPRTSHSFCPPSLIIYNETTAKASFCSPLLPIPSSSNQKMLKQFTLLRHTKSITFHYLYKQTLILALIVL